MTASLAASRRRLVLAALVALFPILAAATAIGTVDIPAGTVLRILLHEVGLADGAGLSPAQQAIVLDLRLPQALLLGLVGGALAIAGATLQATFQNAMAAPSLLGITGGAALGAVLAIYAGFAERAPAALPLAAFVGALATMLLVFAVSHLGGRPSTTSLLLTGVAVGSLMLASVTLVMLWTEEYRLKEVLFWTVGSSAGRSWLHVGLCAPPILIASALLALRHRYVDALSLGEEHALSVGVPVQRVRLELFALCALGCGAAVAVAGTIGFVGLIVPHVVRLVLGPRARALLPASFLVGGGFLVLCDLIARVASGVQREYPVGLVTSFFGVPFFLWLLHRSKRGLA